MNLSFSFHSLNISFFIVVTIKEPEYDDSINGNPDFRDVAPKMPCVLKEFVNIFHEGQNILIVKGMNTPLVNENLIPRFPSVGDL